MDLINILHLTVFTSYSVLSGNIIITHISDLKQTNKHEPEHCSSLLTDSVAKLSSQWSAKQRQNQMWNDFNNSQISPCILPSRCRHLWRLSSWSSSLSMANRAAPRARMPTPAIAAPPIAATCLTCSRQTTKEVSILFYCLRSWG